MINILQLIDLILNKGSIYVGAPEGIPFIVPAYFVLLFPLIFIATTLIALLIKLIKWWI